MIRKSTMGSLPLLCRRTRTSRARPDRGERLLTPKQLYINKGDGTFEEAGYPSGVALNENGRESKRGWELPSVITITLGGSVFQITNFSDDSNVLYHNDGDTNFTDLTSFAGLGEVTLPFGWGTSFLDYDNDGWLDLIVANGHKLIRSSTNISGAPVTLNNLCCFAI